LLYAPKVRLYIVETELMVEPTRNVLAPRRHEVVVMIRASEELSASI
jgi:hypothetical protein